LYVKTKVIIDKIMNMAAITILMMSKIV